MTNRRKAYYAAGRPEETIKIKQTTDDTKETVCEEGYTRKE